MPSNKWAVDLSAVIGCVCVHHCGGIITAARNALDFVIISQLICFSLSFLFWALAVLGYLEFPAENPCSNRKGKHLSGELPDLTQYSTIYEQ